MVKVIVNGTVVKASSRIEAGEIKELARLNGWKRFIVKDEEGRILRPSDFPIEGERTIYIEPYNEAG